MESKYPIMKMTTTKNVNLFKCQTMIWKMSSNKISIIFQYLKSPAKSILNTMKNHSAIILLM